MDQKQINERLLKIARNQQEIIKKLAQMVDPEAVEPPATAPTHPTLREADVILQALPANVKALIDRLEVHGSNVMVAFHPGKNSAAAIQAVQNVVNGLQQQNLLQFPHYNIKQA